MNLPFLSGAFGNAGYSPSSHETAAGLCFLRVKPQRARYLPTLRTCNDAVLLFDELADRSTTQRKKSIGRCSGRLSMIVRRIAPRVAIASRARPRALGRMAERQTGPAWPAPPLKSRHSA